MSAVEDHVAVPISADPTDEPAQRPPNASHVIARLADDVIPVLIERLEASRLGELEVRQDGWRVRLRRRALVDGESAPAPAATSARPRGRHADDATDPSRAAHSRPRPVRDGKMIGSPGVGYYQPRGGLTKGAIVRGGDLVGHVDVLGVLHDVVVPEDGRLSDLLAEPGEAVEYGQPLARLEPESRT